jgi:molybdate transport system substrate-binding protein
MKTTDNAMPKAGATESVTLRVFTTNSSQAVLPKLVPEFERASGCTVSVCYDPGYESRARIARGEATDLYICDAATTDQLAKQNRIVIGSRREFARYGVGVAVLAGAPKPDIGSVESFRRTLLDAETVAYTEAGSSGIHFSGVIERLGIAAQVRAKARTRAAGLIAKLLVSGEAVIAIQHIPELLAVTGIDFVGPLPSGLQEMTIKEICVDAGSKQQKLAQALLEFLTSAAVARVFEVNGYERDTNAQ